jgi:hypothetical protein
LSPGGSMIMSNRTMALCAVILLLSGLGPNPWLPSPGGAKQPGRGWEKPEELTVAAKREQRRTRWIVIVYFTNADDYIRHLGDLGLYLVFPEADKKYLLYEDLAKKPPTGRMGTIDDIKKWNRIYWQESNPDCRDAIGAALNMATVPKHFWIFVPEELEKELFAKEKEFKGLTEEQIMQRNLQTTFAVERVEKGFKVKVQKQERPDSK